MRYSSSAFSIVVASKTNYETVRRIAHNFGENFSLFGINFHTDAKRNSINLGTMGAVIVADVVVMAGVFLFLSCTAVHILVVFLAVSS